MNITRNSRIVQESFTYPVATWPQRMTRAFQINRYIELYAVIPYPPNMSTEPLTATEENTRNFLTNLPVFSSFDEDELSILAKHMSYVQLNKGEFLFVEGDAGNFMGFVLFGLLEVFKTTEKGESVVIARLTKGSPIGEMALIDKSPRSASVQAKQPTTLVTLTEKGFDLLMEKSPQLGVKVIQKIARLLSLNMRRTSSRLADLLRENK